MSVLLELIVNTVYITHGSAARSALLGCATHYDES